MPAEAAVLSHWSRLLRRPHVRRGVVPVLLLGARAAVGGEIVVLKVLGGGSGASTAGPAAREEGEDDEGADAAGHAYDDAFMLRGMSVAVT